MEEQTAQWMDDLSEREQAQIKHAIVYALDHHTAGVPGHGQFLLIAILAGKLDTLERKMTPLQGGTP